MKQKFLSILSLVMITAVTANAQVATNYRGAFAPAPAAQWTDNWTNWSPQTTFYRAPTDSVQGFITTSQTWTKDKVYMLKGLVFIDSLVTLTIEPGTVVLGDHRTVISTLIVQRGGKLIANGTPCNPIVFSSTRPAGQRQRGDWGGITMLGRAVNNRGANISVEGIRPDSIAGRPGKEFHGGTDNNDNSGILRYVRIEYAGFTLVQNEELNSLTMGSIGSGTTIEYVQTSYGNDDAFEWFGGTVNCKYLVAYKTTDDDLDVDMGYSGIVQFALTVKDPKRADISQSEGFESDNGGSSSASSFVTTPRTTAKFYNVTQIGGFHCSSNTGSIVEPSTDLFRKGARLRRGSKIEIYNSILMNNYIGLEMTKEGSTQAGQSPAVVDAVFQNNIIAMDTSFAGTLSAYTAKAKFANDTASANYLNAAANRNSVIGTPCDMLVNAWDSTNYDFRPNGAGTGAALAGSDLNPSISIQAATFAPSATRDLAVTLFELGNGNTNGTFTVTLTVPNTFELKVPGLTLSTTDQAGTDGTLSNLGGQAYTNSDFLFKRNAGGTLITITAKPGVSIAKGLDKVLGFQIQRKNTTPVGTNASLATAVSGGSDTNSSNNSGRQGLSTTL